MGTAWSFLENVVLVKMLLGVVVPTCSLGAPPFRFPVAASIALRRGKEACALLRGPASTCGLSGFGSGGKVYGVERDRQARALLRLAVRQQVEVSVMGTQGQRQRAPENEASKEEGV